MGKAAGPNQQSQSPLTSLNDFLSTDKGAAWLAITVDDWEQKLLRVKRDAEAASTTGLNSWLQDCYVELQKKEEWRIPLSSIQTVDTSSLAGFQSSALQVPLLVTEEYIRRRALGLLARYTRRYFRFFAWRVAAAGILLEATKAGVRRLAARRGSKRVQAVVNFLLDAALPTVYFGPALGICHGVTGLMPASWLVDKIAETAAGGGSGAAEQGSPSAAPDASVGNGEQAGQHGSDNNG
ncbi:hypothetical protein CEUSTIGMA_g5946.t1 [Chlamydomonas eustigma]|uniref:Uncharacterized protein n=1 Tax=Chlamydomonas eustigma TaxID=1157962 RepID=A0A250X5Y8_9CHLO|nr:hypothetical protein CEUSTIGMA_g5946.t1 [Chlamydomonas eustigma]|eukprot:GAX78507.1 hypothetical protein CEUSTIGMA_g5946.t1 [Chlamydomonas eustigma]